MKNRMVKRQKMNLKIQEKHTIFAIDASMTPHKLQTSHQQPSINNIFLSSSQKIFRQTVYYPRTQQNSKNNWMYPLQLLGRKHQIKQFKQYDRKAGYKQGRKKKKQEIIRLIEHQIPDMKVESMINSNLMKKNTDTEASKYNDNNHYNNGAEGRLSFQKYRQMQKMKQKQKLKERQNKIRKISILSLSSDKSLHQSYSPQLAYNLNRYSQPKRRVHNYNIKKQSKDKDGSNNRIRDNYMPITYKPIIEQDLDNSHYNNGKYQQYNDKGKKRVETVPNHQLQHQQQHEYQHQLKRLKKQLQNSENIITSLRFKDLENQISKLKQKDKQHQQVIAQLVKEFTKTHNSSNQPQMLEQHQKNKVKNWVQGRSYKEQQPTKIRKSESQKESKQKNARPQTSLRTRVKTQQSKRPNDPQSRNSVSSMNKNNKNQQKKKEQHNFHVLADHAREIQSQKQFLLINPEKTREKLETCYSQLKRLSVPQININPFRIPKIPNPPKHEQQIQDYLKLAKQLCKCLNFNVQEIDIVVKRYRNCISFKVKDNSENIVIWNFDGKLYTGGWKQIENGNGKKQGSGMQISNQYCFKGQFLDGKKNGKGIIQYYNGSVFEGQWKNGKMQGKGIFFDRSDSSYFQGQWDKGQQKGRGVIKYSKKHYYTGQFKNLTKNGKGTQFFQNGDIYEGNFQKGLQNGHGIYYYNTGQFYVGNFVNSKKQGTGLLLSNKFSTNIPQKQQQKPKIQQYYYGEFNKGNKSGYGILRKTDGTYFFGYFHNDLPHGPGILQNQPYFQRKTHNRKNKNIVKITGIWKGGQLVVSNKNIQSQKSQSKQLSENI